VQVLKIDRSLTTDLRADPKTHAIVEGVVGMAHRMGIRVIMEGIEEEADAEACRSVDADLGQGWLFGRPVTWAQAARAGVGRGGGAAAGRGARGRRPWPPTSRRSPAARCRRRGGSRGAGPRGAWAAGRGRPWSPAPGASPG
jgi:hypothetical protein